MFALANVIDQTGQAVEEGIGHQRRAGGRGGGGGSKCCDYQARWRALLLDLLTRIFRESDKLSPVYITLAVPTHN